MKVTGSAVISDCGMYRYRLTREFGKGPLATFIMLNPSTADAEVPDQTIRKCIGFARKWECGSIQVVNLFAFRSRSPAAMKKALDPVGPENEKAFNEAMLIAMLRAPFGPVVCAWGTHGSHRDQDMVILGWLRKYPKIKPVALGITKGGHPQHPLLVAYAAPLVGYQGRR